MKFVIAKKHNIFHYCIVILIRTVYFFIGSAVSSYFIASGFILFKVNLVLPFSSFSIQQATHYSLQLPYFAHIILLLNKNICWHKCIAPEWQAFNIGIPLILIGSSIFLINFFNFLFSIFSLNYNHTHCPFCKESIKIKH